MHSHVPKRDARRFATPAQACSAQAPGGVVAMDGPALT